MRSRDVTTGPRTVAFLHDARRSSPGWRCSCWRCCGTSTRRADRAVVVVPGFRDQWRTSPPQLLAALDELGVPVLRPDDPGDTRLVSSVRELAGTASVLRRSGAVVAHIYTRHAEAARKQTLAARLGRVPGLVRTEHLPPSHHMRRATKYLVKPFDLMTDVIVTDSDGDREEQLRILGRRPDKVVRSYCGIDTDLFDPDHDVRAVKASLGLDPDVPLVGTVGRMHKQKGQRHFVDAAAHVITAYGPVDFLLVGDGELRADLERQVADLGIEKHVHFVGFQQDYVPYMEAMDVAVMPSLWEGFSISMQEFMALGKPLVATDHPSFREAIVDGEHGLIVPVADGAAMGDAIVRLLEDGELGALARPQRPRPGATRVQHPHARRRDDGPVRPNALQGLRPTRGRHTDAYPVQPTRQTGRRSSTSSRRWRAGTSPATGRSPSAATRCSRSASASPRSLLTTSCTHALEMAGPAARPPARATR